MNKIQKLAVLFFTMMLFLSISKDILAEVSQPLTQSETAAYPSSFLSKHSFGEIYGLHQPYQITVNVVGEMPAPDWGQLKNGAFGGLFNPVFNYLGLLKGHLNLAQENNLGISIRAIIFPFHYFW